jgi:succinate dehydrogenase / fumarate reductase, membrane anchor subunit
MVHVVKAYTKIPVGAHYGLGDWLLQRLTAVVMALYTLVLAFVLIKWAPSSHAEWRSLFGGGFFRAFTMLFVIALLYHAWVGMRDILMDYVHGTALRLSLQSAVVIVLLLYLIWSASILWGRP